MIDESFRDFWFSNYRGCHLYDVDEYLHQGRISYRISHMNGFASLKALLRFRPIAWILFHSSRLSPRQMAISLL
jgi:hypothetical protein